MYTVLVKVYLVFHECPVETLHKRFLNLPHLWMKRERWARKLARKDVGVGTRNLICCRANLQPSTEWRGGVIR